MRRIRDVVPKGLTVVMLVAALASSSLPAGLATPRDGGRDRCWKAWNDVGIGRWWKTRLPPVEYPPDTRTEYRERVRWRFSVDQRDPRVIYIWNLWRAFKSTDGGCTWHESYNTLTTSSSPAPDQTDEIAAIQAPQVANDDDVPTYMVVQRGLTPFLGIEDPASGEWDIAPMTDSDGVPLSGRTVQFWVAPSDPDTLYLEMGTDIYLREDRYDRSRLYGSIDGGRTWDLRSVFSPDSEGFTQPHGDFSCPAGPSRCPRVHVTAMEVHPQDPNVLWTGTFDGIFRSEDGGRSWHNLYPGAWETIGRVTAIELVAAPSQPLRISVYGVFATGWSTDEGRTWELRRPPRGITEEDDSLVTPVDSAASPDRAHSLVFLLGSPGGRQVQLLGPRGWTYVSPAPSRCSDIPRESREQCLRFGAYVPWTRSYLAVERDGSHLWKLETH